MLHYTLKRLVHTEKNVLWKSKGFPAKKITTSTITTGNSFSPSVKWYRN